MDAGDITCELSNKKGKESVTCKLNVTGESCMNILYLICTKLIKYVDIRFIKINYIHQG